MSRCNIPKECLSDGSRRIATHESGISTVSWGPMKHTYGRFHPVGKLLRFMVFLVGYVWWVFFQHLLRSLDV